MASGKKISRRRWDFARRRPYGNIFVKNSILPEFRPTSQLVKPFIKWRAPASALPRRSTGRTAKRPGRRGWYCDPPGGRSRFCGYKRQSTSAGRFRAQPVSAIPTTNSSRFCVPARYGGCMRISLKPPQASVFECRKRFRVLVAGRRFGKTYLAMVELIRAAWAPGSLVWYVGPTIKQSKRILWKLLKKMTKELWASTPSETDLRIELLSGGTICVRGADNYDSLRGDGL